MKRNRSPWWRAAAAVLLFVLVLASAPAVAQASTGSHHGPGNWIEWLSATFTHCWQLVAGGMSTDGGGEIPSPHP